MIWNEKAIARAIALQTLERKCLVMVNNCNWTGHECDVLGVTKDLRMWDAYAQRDAAKSSEGQARDHLHAMSGGLSWSESRDTLEMYERHPEWLTGGKA